MPSSVPSEAMRVLPVAIDGQQQLFLQRSVVPQPGVITAGLSPSAACTCLSRDDRCSEKAKHAGSQAVKFCTAVINMLMAPLSQLHLHRHSWAKAYRHGPSHLQCHQQLRSVEAGGHCRKPQARPFPPLARQALLPFIDAAHEATR